MNNYYVYVYIDPRNFEAFYYGKGKGSRKESHLKDYSGSEKSKLIQEILDSGLKPIIRVIAKNLSEKEALLVEKTLLWKLGKQLTNVSTGHFSANFRPQKTMYKEIAGFDFQNTIHYYNIGEGRHRNWDDYTKFNFISAGQAPIFKDAMLRLNQGDVVAAYLKKHGFVGIGRITQIAKPIREVFLGNQPLLQLPLKCKNMHENSDDENKSEYVAQVEWLKTVPRKDAKWKPRSGLFTTQLVTASLENKNETIQFLEEEFEINLRELII